MIAFIDDHGEGLVVREEIWNRKRRRTGNWICREWSLRRGIERSRWRGI